MKTATAFVIVGSITGLVGTTCGYLAARRIPSSRKYSFSNIMAVTLPAAGGIAGTYFLLTKLGKEEA